MQPTDLPTLVSAVSSQGVDTVMASSHHLRMLRRGVEAELVAAPVVMLALFEALQANPSLSMEARRVWLEPLHARLGSKLRIVHHVGTSIDPETAAFFTRLGIQVGP